MNYQEWQWTIWLWLILGTIAYVLIWAFALYMIERAFDAYRLKRNIGARK